MKKGEESMGKSRSKLSWKKKVRKWQIVLADMVEGGMSEREVEEKYRLREGLIRLWYAEEGFRAELVATVRVARFRAMAMMGQSAMMAAAELVSLARSGKEETKRKACVDIMKMQIDENEKEDAADKPKMKISEEEASAVVKALAEVRRRQSEVRR
jgi:hypothetical protein